MFGCLSGGRCRGRAGIEHVWLGGVARARGLKECLPLHGAQRQVHLGIGDAAGDDAVFVCERRAPAVAAEKVDALVVHVPVLTGDLFAGADAPPEPAVRAIERREPASVVFGDDGGHVLCCGVLVSPRHRSGPRRLQFEVVEERGPSLHGFLAFADRSQAGGGVAAAGGLHHRVHGLAAFLRDDA